VNWEPSEHFAEWQGCLGCAHYRHGRCAAYPRGIPIQLISGQVDHMVPRPGQVEGILFEPMDWDVFRATRQRVPAREEPAAQPTG
jgi:hypothetical protein